MCECIVEPLAITTVTRKAIWCVLRCEGVVGWHDTRDTMMAVGKAFITRLDNIMELQGRLNGLEEAIWLEHLKICNWSAKFGQLLAISTRSHIPSIYLTVFMP